MEYINVTWNEIKLQVKKVNPTLYHVLKTVESTENQLPLIKAKFGFGEAILTQGNLNVGGSPQLKKQLNYSKIPLFLILNKTIEIHIDTGVRTVPLNLLKPGEMLGLFEYLDVVFGIDKQPKWSACAGSKSLFLLPKITEKQGLKRLQLVYNLPTSIQVNHFCDHWALCKAIANSPEANIDWHTEILLFTRDWFDKRHDPSRAALHNYFYNMAWKQAQYAIGKIDLSLDWEMFANTISARRLKPSPYLSDQIKHVLAIAAGRWPGFRPIIDDSTVPLAQLQYAFIETYQLKKYTPIFMHAYLPQIGGKMPFYYSLHYPTLLEGTANKKTTSTIMLDLRDIKLLLDTLIKNCSPTQIQRDSVIKHTQFDFFHAEKNIYQDIKSSHCIIEEDPNFLKAQEAFPDRIFCYTSPFWYGCIRIIT